jgi:hypothetical protein
VLDVDAELVQRLLHALDHQIDAAARDDLARRRGRIRDRRGQLDDVLALVAVLRHLLAARPRLDRLAELVDLGAVVVHVELALDRMARERQQARDRVAIGGVAGMADVHRPGRIGRDELDQNALALRRRPPAPLVAGSEHVSGRRDVPAVGEEDVQEPGAGDLDAVDPVAEPVLQRRAEALGNLARRRLERLGHQHRRVGRVVTQPGLLRPLQRRRHGAVAELGGGGLDGGAEVFDGRSHAGQ